MVKRRRFLLSAPLSVLAARSALAQVPTAPGAPPTFGMQPAAGPEVTAATFAEADKLLQTPHNPAQLDQLARSWRSSMPAMLERRTGPHRMPLADADVPAMVWHPAQPGQHLPRRERLSRPPVTKRALPKDDADIAYASVAELGEWIRKRQLSVLRLTQIYLDRIARFDGRLRSVITLMAESALAKAHQCDAEIAAGRYRGPLHGIPYGVKDLLDTAGVRTTWGAEFMREHVPTTTATVVRRLDAAGAVLIAKLSLGALAMNDIWFGGQTMNPWLPEEGSSGSSAGPGAATAAALVAFSIGSETNGSIVSPSMRCGLTGLRPTFGRVPRTGAMTLCWSLDKLGPMTRSVEDAFLVLRAIHGHDAGDTASVNVPLDADLRGGVRGLRVGVVANWMHDAPATDVDRAALARLQQMGAQIVPLTLPEWPYQCLNTILFAEAAAAFEDAGRDGRMDQLKMQTDDAWPNTLRQARYLSAVDLVQADRMRRKVSAMMAGLFQQCDVMLVPSLRDDILTITNHTGHPSLTLRTGFVKVSEARSDWAPDPAHPLSKFDPPREVPHGVTLLANLFDEGMLARVAYALEQGSGVAARRPPQF